MNKINPKKYGSAIIGAALLATSSASATIIASDNFDYANGDLTGANGGTGWNGAYTGTNSLQISGGQIDDSGGPGEVGVNFRGLTQTINLTNFAGGEIWMGFDGQLTLAGSWGFGGISPYQGGTEKGLVGAQQGRDAFSLSNLVTTPTGFNRTVILFDLNANTTSLWVGAIGSTVDVSVAAVETGTLNINGTDNFRFALNSTDAGGSIQFDNFALATTSAEVVTAVPEPSSAALIGLGGLALLLRRRKG